MYSVVLGVQLKDIVVVRSLYTFRMSWNFDSFDDFIELFFFHSEMTEVLCHHNTDLFDCTLTGLTDTQNNGKVLGPR